MKGLYLLFIYLLIQIILIPYLKEYVGTYLVYKLNTTFVIKKKNQLLNDEFVKLNTIFENKIYHVIIDILISKIRQ